MTIYPADVRGEKKWCLSYSVAGKRLRRFFDSKSAAEIERDVLSDQRKSAGEIWASLSSVERNELLAVNSDALKEGVTLRALLDAHKAGKLGVEPQQVRLLGDAIKETVDAKRAAKRRADYVDGLQLYLEAFAKGRESTPVNRLTAADLERWFTERKEAPATRASNLGRLSALFGLCYRRKYIRENPCDFVERVTVDRKAPSVLTLDESQRVLNYCFVAMPDYLAWCVLSLMAGIRPEELELLEWSSIDLKRGLVFISADVSKVHQRRIVELEPAAVEWLKLGGELPVSKQNRKRQVRRLRKLLGFTKWPQDILRHTAASYLIAKHQDAGKVALWLGNSPGILLRHYRELVTKEEAVKFWAMVPKVILKPKSASPKPFDSKQR